MVVLSGAGISAESGLSTFRDTDGLWKNYNWERLASIDGFYEDPKAVLDFYNMRRKRLNEVAPNHTHKLLAELEKWHDVTIITQNVDNLHERAGSTRVIHLHGELTKMCSSRNPNDPRYIVELKPEAYETHVDDLAGDGSPLRPFIVWFGEAVPMIETAIDYVSQADILIIIGTSLNVYPAAGLINYYRGRDVVLINKSAVARDLAASLVITDPIGEVLSQL
jgi:NAD-dependent deacetylase